MSDSAEERQTLLNEDREARQKVKRSWVYRLFCDQSSTLHRYLFMFLLCLSQVGDYFIFDNPAALEDHFLKDLRISETKYMGFYASYQWTSTFSCTIGGYLVDKFFNYGTSFAVLSFLITVSQVAFALGAWQNSYWVMYFSRAIYGVIDSPFGVVTNGLAVKWFHGKELNLVFALKTSFGRIGASVNMYVMDPIYNYFRKYFVGHKALGMALMTAAGLCLFCALVTVYMMYLDNSMDKKRDGKNTDKTEVKKSEEVTIRGIFKALKLTFWLIATTTGVYSIAFFPFIGLGKVFFESKYNLEPGAADFVNALPFLVAAVILPFIGKGIDKIGRNLTWMLCGLVLITSSHLVFAFLTVTPFVGACLLGTGYSIMTGTMWALVPEVVEERYLGTAYGIMATFVSLIQTAVNYLTGYLVDNYGYFVLELFFVGCSLLALISGILLTLTNYIHGEYLNSKRSDKPEPGK